MIKAFFVEKNVDRVLSYVNPDSFTWIGSGENDVLDNIDDVRRFFKAQCKLFTNAYKLLSEEYSIGAASYDSCIVITKIKFQGLNERKYYRPSLHFSFYFQLIDDKLWVTHYHVHIPIKKSLFNSASYFMLNQNIEHPNEFLQADFQYQTSLLNKFSDTGHIAMKSFCYEKGLPYCYVNQPFLNLVGFHNLKNFISQEKFSSLAHIHPDDQRRYIEHLKASFPEVRALNPSQEWQWHASYHIIYRTQTFDKSSKTVFEWGNLFTLNGRPLVNSFVLPLENSTPLFNFDAKTLESSSTELSLLNDCGVNIGNIMTIYPKHQKLFIRDQSVDLTPTEFKLLLILAEEINVPIRAEKFYDNLWNDQELSITSLTLKAHMSNLRHKLKDASGGLINIINVKNLGYYLQIPEF